MVKKIAIITSNNAFLDPVIRELKKRDTLIETQIFSEGSLEDAFYFQDLMEWADYAFFDFIHRPLPFASHMLNSKCRITARLHGLEVYDKAIRDVNWPRVNLICSPPQLLRFKALPIKDGPATINSIGIGVDITPTEKPKAVFGRNIGIFAITPLPRKRLYTTIETFCELLSVTKNRSDMDGVDWKLHVRGLNPTNWRHDEAVEYVNFIHEFCASAKRAGIDLLSKIQFHNHMPPSQFQAFLDGLDIVISNSMQEGYHKSIFEAMAHGVFPLVHRWYGADALFPKESLFLTQGELVRKIMEWHEANLAEKTSRSLSVQSYVQEFHDENECAGQIADVILDG